MTLREIILIVEKLDENLVIFARKNSEWDLDSPAALVLDSDVEHTGVDLEELTYFLEVLQARDVLEVWSAWRGGRAASDNDRIRAILYYVENDAYIEE